MAGYVSFRGLSGAAAPPQPLAPARAVYIDASVGAAGDMLLAALLDCADQLGDGEEFLARLKEMLGTLEAIRGQWDLTCSRAVRSEGRITGKHIKVISVFNHEELPPPGTAPSPDVSHDHSHAHAHAHAHDHDHDDSSPLDQDHAHAHSHSHASETRNLSSITSMIEQSTLPPQVRTLCLAAFTELALAESRVHGVGLEQVHFHEVGAIDSIVDTCGTVAALHLLGVDPGAIFCSALPLGSGTVFTAHGLLPVPAPATAFLLRGMVTCPGPKVSGELVTPTGASLVRALCGLPSLALRPGGADAPPPSGQASGGSSSSSGRQGVLPPAGFRVDAVGVGCGTKDFPKHPNVVRVILGTLPSPGAGTSDGTSASPSASASASAISSSSSGGLWDEEDLLVLTANIDDQSAELLAHVMQRCLDEGARDAWQAPITMKKGRLAAQINVLCRPAERSRFVELLFRESSTLGVRVSGVQRCALRRRECVLESEWGPVPGKASFLGDELVNCKPEFEDARRLAEAQGVPLKTLLGSL